MSLSIIYARSENHCIGNLGKVPWNLPDESKSFYRLTQGKAIIMGRRTYEDHRSQLPGRLNIVLSSDPSYRTVPGIRCLTSLHDALVLARDYSEEYFIIGGTSLIVDVFDQAQTVYETVVQAIVAGDTFLPEMDFSGWTTEVLLSRPVDDRHPFSFTVQKHIRQT